MPLLISASRGLRPMSELPPTTAPVLAFYNQKSSIAGWPVLLHTNGQQWFYSTTHGTAHASDFHGWTELRLTK